MKKVLLTAVVAGLAGLAVWYFWICNSEKRQIGKLIENMAALPGKLSGGTAESGILQLAQVDQIFAEQLVVRSSRKNFDRTFSREDIRAMLMFLKKNVSKTTVNIANVEIFVADRDNATFDFEAEVVIFNRREGKVEEILLVSRSAAKQSGKWRITSIATESAVQR